MMSSLLNRWHERWLVTGFGERTKAMLHGLNWVISSAIISRILCGLATMFSARWMGPALFGEANLALASTYYVQIPLFFGLHSAMMHFVPQQRNSEKIHWLADGMRLTTAFAFLTLTCAFLGRGVFARWHGVSERIFNLALLWCLGNFLYSLATAVFSSEEDFRARAFVEIVFAIIFPLLVFTMRMTHRVNGAYYVIALSLGYAMAGLLGLSQSIPRLVGSPLSFDRMKALAAYGLIGTVGGVASALTQAPSRLIAHRYLSLRDIGVLSAYQGGSYQMALFFLSAAVQVFFPIASRTPNKRILFQKIHRLALVGAAPGILGLTGCLLLYFLVLGKQYPLRSMYVGIFASAGVLILYQGVLSWFWAATGRKGLLASVTIGLLSGVLNLIGCLVLIPSYGIPGAGLAMSISASMTVGLYYLPWVQQVSGLHT